MFRLIILLIKLRNICKGVMYVILDKDSRVKTKILNAIVEDPEIVLLLKEKYVNEEIWKFCIERDPTDRKSVV